MPLPADCQQYAKKDRGYFTYLLLGNLFDAVPEVTTISWIGWFQHSLKLLFRHTPCAAYDSRQNLFRYTKLSLVMFIGEQVREKQEAVNIFDVVLMFLEPQCDNTLRHCVNIVRQVWWVASKDMM